jgi:hypothetical protein
MKKELAMPMKKEKLWWDEELELAAAACHPDDPEDTRDQRLLEARPFQQVMPMD